MKSPSELRASSFGRSRRSVGRSVGQVVGVSQVVGLVQIVGVGQVVGVVVGVMSSPRIPANISIADYDDDADDASCSVPVLDLAGSPGSP